MSRYHRLLKANRNKETVLLPQTQEQAGFLKTFFYNRLYSNMHHLEESENDYKFVFSLVFIDFSKVIHALERDFMLQLLHNQGILFL